MIMPLWINSHPPASLCALFNPSGEFPSLLPLLSFHFLIYLLCFSPSLPTPNLNVHSLRRKGWLCVRLTVATPYTE